MLVTLSIETSHHRVLTSNTMTGRREVYVKKQLGRLTIGFFMLLFDIGMMVFCIFYV